MEGCSTQNADIVMVFDLDNTPLNNDRVPDDLRRHLVGAVG